MTTETTHLEPGTVVFHDDPVGTRLAIIDEHLDTEIRVIAAGGEYAYAQPGSLTPYPVHAEIAGLIKHATRLRKDANAVLQQEVQAAQTQDGETHQLYSAALDKIEQMRRYAIQAHRDGDICRDGLDRFLDTHDLQPYRPRFRAAVRYEAVIDVDACDAAAAQAMLEDDVDVSVEPGGADITIVDTSRHIDELEEDDD